MSFSSKDKENLLARYNSRYSNYGYSPFSLGWDKGKQEIRFSLLLSLFELKTKSFLDVGCGFGDLNKFLLARTTNYSYLGIDLVDKFLLEGKKRYKKESIVFQKGEFLETMFNNSFDYIIASGVFNYKLEEDNYQFIDSCLKKAFDLCEEGIAFDFLSDQVDYKLEDTFHASPMRILEIAYSLSRNVVLRNDYMPFEFCVIIFKDDSFDKKDTVFCRYKKNRGLSSNNNI